MVQKIISCLFHRFPLFPPKAVGHHMSQGRFHTLIFPKIFQQPFRLRRRNMEPLRLSRIPRQRLHPFDAAGRQVLVEIGIVESIPCHFIYRIFRPFQLHMDIGRLGLLLHPGRGILLRLPDFAPPIMVSDTGRGVTVNNRNYLFKRIDLRRQHITSSPLHGIQ